LRDNKNNNYASILVEYIGTLKKGGVLIMQGIQYVTDDKGQKIAVQIDLKQFGEIWEDFFDNLLSRQRADEPRESIDSVRERLKKQGKLHV
jgi:hypothetical protein